MLAAAVVIKLTSKGPVLFTQERLGQYGKRFIFLKFRTMYINCGERLHKEYIKKFICKQKSASLSEKKGESAIYKLQDDPRITPIGRFLRRTSLDELPQFINVVKGDMSLVGPRPPIPYECAHYDLWHKKRISEVKPGITGLWQVKGRSAVTFDEMVRFDIRYSREYSLWMDIGILLMTPWAVLTCKGAY
jgi:lipopolysaccharide/colanic/teichoic acid biosynthesis glycosyltransferase